jgi:hypothetical protein
VNPADIMLEKIEVQEDAAPLFYDITPQYMCRTKDHCAVDEDHAYEAQMHKRRRCNIPGPSATDNVNRQNAQRFHTRRRGAPGLRLDTRLRGKSARPAAHPSSSNGRFERVSAQPPIN